LDPGITKQPAGRRQRLTAHSFSISAGTFAAFAPQLGERFRLI
jgi:hypothetical protein